MKTTATNRKLRELLLAIRAGTLIPRPEFQRRLVWVNKHKVAFVKTVLDGYPFPEIYVAAGEVDPNSGEGQEYLVDGQQRITTLFQYFEGSKDLRLGTEISPFSELSEDERRAFLQYEVVIRDLGDIPIPEILEVFTRINSTNYSLNAMEIHNARYDGEFKQFAERIAEWRFFDEYRIFAAADGRRMNDLRFVLTLVISTISTYFNRDDDIEEYLKQYDDEFPQSQQVEDEISKVIGFVESCELGKESRAWKKADLLTLLVEIHRALFRDDLKLDPAKTGRALRRFYKEVDLSVGQKPQDEEAAKYYFAALQANNDRSSRITRGKVLAGKIRGAAGPAASKVSKSSTTDRR